MNRYSRCPLSFSFLRLWSLNKQGKTHFVQRFLYSFCHSFLILCVYRLSKFLLLQEDSSDGQQSGRETSRNCFIKCQNLLYVLSNDDAIWEILWLKCLCSVASSTYDDAASNKGFFVCSSCYLQSSWKLYYRIDSCVVLAYWNEVFDALHHYHENICCLQLDGKILISF